MPPVPGGTTTSILYIAAPDSFTLNCPGVYPALDACGTRGVGVLDEAGSSQTKLGSTIGVLVAGTVFVGLGVLVPVAVLVAVGVLVLLTVLLAIGVLVLVAVGVLVPIAILVAVGVLVPVAVLAAVGVLVPVATGVLVPVATGVLAPLTVLVAVDVPVGGVPSLMATGK